MPSQNGRTDIELSLDELVCFDEQSRQPVEIDAEVVAGIRRGLADVRAGRMKTFAEFDADFRAKHYKSTNR